MASQPSESTVDSTRTGPVAAHRFKTMAPEMDSAPLLHVVADVRQVLQTVQTDRGASRPGGPSTVFVGFALLAAASLLIITNVLRIGRGLAVSSAN